MEQPKRQLNFGFMNGDNFVILDNFDRMFEGEIAEKYFMTKILKHSIKYGQNWQKNQSNS